MALPGKEVYNDIGKDEWFGEKQFGNQGYVRRR